MRLCTIEECEGEVLGKSIYHANGKLLLGAGYRITSLIKAKLVERGFNHVYIMEEGTDEVIPQDVISDEVRLQSKAQFSDKISEVRRQSEFKDLTRDKAVELLEKGYLKSVNITYDMRMIVEEILKDISAAGSRFLNTVMIKSEETYFIDHAINVTVMSILMGRKYRFSKPELVSLALGSFLHDIGMIIIEQIKGSDNPKKAESLYKEHPTFGYLLIRNSPDVSPMETQIVNQHHEFQDGTGFPIGLKGENLPPIKPIVREMKGHIFRLAEICCVANAFDNMVYNPLKPPGKQMSIEQAIKQIILDSERIYNRDVVQTLLQVVPIYPVGATIKVLNLVDPHLVGYVGVVAKINEKNINKPVIILTKNKFMKKIKPIIIDTSKFTTVDLQILL
ncbi:MAG: HD domain-containing protein [Candidatus Latescibacteria bacterium]|nr:HD domain-containing protein [Candidatus Latescibacterota bacterium]